jgi:class 3 adenylate cyclase
MQVYVFIGQFLLFFFCYVGVGNFLSYAQHQTKQDSVLQKERINALMQEKIARENKKRAIEEAKRAVEAEKRAKKSELEAKAQRNTAFAVGVVAILLAVFALYQMRIAYQQKQIAQAEKAKAEKLLLNILPVEIAEELKTSGNTPPPQLYKNASVMFTDYSGFTEATERNPISVVLQDLNECFVAFDRITAKYGIEKIKTIGDAFMCAKGIPTSCSSHAVDMVLSGLEMQRFMIARKRQKDAKGDFCFQCRLGIHSGEVIAGVVGERKFCYDIWGNTVNTANRMELSGKVEHVNISRDTMELVKDFFELESREPIQVKGKGIMQLYFVLRIKSELSKDETGIYTNDAFKDLYKQRFGRTYDLPV